MGSNGDADIVNRLVAQWGKAGQGERNGESSMEANTLTYVK